jgi:hypothetical protein
MNIFEFVAQLRFKTLFFEFLKQIRTLWQGRKPLDLWNVL